MNLWQTLYSTALLPSFLAGARVIARKSAKVRETLAGREGLWPRLETQVRERRRDGPLVWFHVASAGEYLQAQPVMERLMAAGVQCALTLTSVSGYRWAIKRREAYPHLVLVDYLPFDTRANMRRLLDLLRPTAVVYVKFDLWPNMIWETRARDIPQFLISATLHAKSKRVTGFLGRSLYRSLYRCLDGIFTVAAEDSARFLATCPGHPRVLELGDTRFDSVLDRKKTIEPPRVPDFIKTSRVLVLGSTWPEDERHVLPVARQALEYFPDLVLVVVPHETDQPHLVGIEQALKGMALSRFTKLSPDAGACRVILVDTVGQLSALYHYATVAYVGGAFGRGVHNVMEPSAMGVPTIFGPFHQNSPEAMALLARQKCFSIADGDGFRKVLYHLLDDADECRRIGADAAAFIEGEAGAADRCFELIKESLR